MMDDNFDLKDFNDLNILMEIQESFSTATGLASVLADVRGVHIGPGSGFSDFCNKIRSHQQGRDSCTMSNYIAASIARKNKKPYVYKCHAGLIDMVVPIIVDSKFIGSMLAGQIKCNEEEFPKIKKMPTKFNWKEEPECLAFYNKIETLPRKKIEAAAQTLFLMTNYIVEKSIAESSQIKLNEQNKLLIAEIKHKHKLEKSLKEAELKALQHQINPHFLFNVLNMINRLVHLEEYDTAQSVLTAFTEMLRYSASDIENVVTLEQELSYIKKYLYIQSLRFGNRIKYKLDIEPNTLSLEIPCFTLQPLVENSMIHGLEPKEAGGNLFITTKTVKDGIHIIIEDNGIGMPANTLQKLINPNFEADKQSIGFRNVNMRLKLFFGENYRFHVTSKVNKGTKVVLVIPKTG
ncbi:MAG: sensor histidine kinase [Zhaonellaceae bacterium]|jgi:ligand-binding sensor protein/two-component sensor histidine kinase|nr:histidine kinase [Clostridia bacterium]